MPTAVSLLHTVEPFINADRRDHGSRNLSITFSPIGKVRSVSMNAPASDTVDLVILDMRMPYNGGRAFEQLKRIKSDVKVIIASGYTEDQRIRQMYEQGCIGFIQKPFRINKLSEKILKALQN